MGTIAIIGAGVAGLISADSAMQCGLTPTVLEAQQDIGGIWNPVTGKTWENLETNVSRYCCVFSHFPWKQPVSDFPKRDEVYAYLADFASEKNLYPCIQMGAKVQRVARTIDGKWAVQWLQSGRYTTQYFDFVLVCSGIFSKAFVPSVEGAESFTGRISHAADYKSPEPFEGKKVVVVGNAFSGSEIASEIASTAAKVVLVSPKNLWILPHHLPPNNNPLDLELYTRSASARRPKHPAPASYNRAVHEWFKTICLPQEELHDLKVAQNPSSPAFLTISDTIVDAVRSHQVAVRQGKVTGFNGNRVLFSDGSGEEADEVVFCTGYRSDLPFLSWNIRTAIDLQPDDPSLPTLLYQTMLHPDLPGMAFIGLYRGPFFGVMELQSLLACKLFTGQIPPIPREEMLAGIEAEKSMREASPRPQFPHADYVGMCEDLAEKIGIKPDLARVQTEDPELYFKLWNGPFTTASYFLDDPLCLEMFEETNSARKR